METGAFLFMIIVQLTVAGITGYLFYKVLSTPPNAEPDSFSENDDDPREEELY